MPLESLGYFLGSCGWTCWRSRMASSEKIGGAATSARFAPCVWKRHLVWKRTERTFFPVAKWQCQIFHPTISCEEHSMCLKHVADHRRKHRSFADALKSASEVSKSSNGFKCSVASTLWHSLCHFEKVHGLHGPWESINSLELQQLKYVCFFIIYSYLFLVI
jgi:hypothetical protein